MTNVLLVVGAGAILLIIASRTYPFWIARLFDLDDRRACPSEALADRSDYVKSPTSVVFAHHFASIAGAGPIIGPIIALAFGWWWAWLWIVGGGIFYGAVHDMTAMCVSLREGGRTIAEVARRTLGNFGYFLFVAFLLIVISFVNAIFLKLSAIALTSSYPLQRLGLAADQTLLLTETRPDGVVHGRIGGIATTSVIAMTLLAPLLGVLITKKRLHSGLVFLIASAVCVGGVLAGFRWPVTLAPGTWMIVLAAYAFVACWIPVWLILQPRDVMNVQLLYGGLALLAAGTIAAGIGGSHMQLAASAIEEGSRLRGPFWPIMFITIACGAISGFHSVVATGTTVRQLPRETDCRRIGFNAMLLESFLALLVLTAVAGQLSLGEYHESMDIALGGSPVQTFAIGAGRVFEHLGIPMAVGCVLGILIIEGFLVTTLDTAVRLARYLFEELWSCLAGGNAPAPLRHPLVNTACAVGMMLLFAYSPNLYGALWPFFGAGNQLIGALTLLTVSIWLLRRGRAFWFTAIPAAFMVATAISALAMLVYQQWTGPDDDPLRPVIVGAGLLLLALSGGFVVVAVARLRSAAREALAGAASS